MPHCFLRYPLIYMTFYIYAQISQDYLFFADKNQIDLKSNLVLVARQVLFRFMYTFLPDINICVHFSIS